MTYKEQLEDELKTFKEIFITHFNSELKEKLTDIIEFYEEEIKREERINDYERKHLSSSPADQASVVQYP